MCFCYTHQHLFIRWCNTISTHFTEANGVKQCGIISPILFHIYMDKLSVALNSSGIVGYLGNVFLNYLCYADDLCLISLSSTKMQQVLNICQNHAIDHQLLYNGSKSYCLCFKSKSIKIIQALFFLNLLNIPIVENCRYLGITISIKNSDLDLKRQMRKYMLTLIYCSESFLNVLLMLNVIYLRHTVLIYIVHQCGLTALK